MQIAPSEVRNMSLWQYTALVQGWNKANEPEHEPLTPDEEEELFELIEEERPIWVQ
jgi:hypothetical protein